MAFGEPLPPLPKRDRRAYHQKWRDNNKEKVRGYWKKNRFGITLEQWEALFESQERSCAICKSTKPRNSRGWATDHNHDTGEVRGILCNPCNVMLGMAQDNMDVLLSAVTYLERFE